MSEVALFETGAPLTGLDMLLYLPVYVVCSLYIMCHIHLNKQDGYNSFAWILLYLNTLLNCHLKVNWCQLLILKSLILKLLYFFLLLTKWCRDNLLLFLDVLSMNFMVMCRRHLWDNRYQMIVFLLKFICFIKVYDACTLSL